MVSSQHLFWDRARFGGAQCPCAEDIATTLADTAAYGQASFERGAITTSGVAGLIANTALCTSGKCRFEDVVGNND